MLIVEGRAGLKWMLWSRLSTGKLDDPTHSRPAEVHTIQSDQPNPIAKYDIIILLAWSRRFTVLTTTLNLRPIRTRLTSTKPLWRSADLDLHPGAVDV